GDSLSLSLEITNTSNHPISLLPPKIEYPIGTTVGLAMLFPGTTNYTIVDELGASSRVYKIWAPRPMPVVTLAPKAEQSFALIIDRGTRADRDARAPFEEPQTLFTVPGIYMLKLTVFVLH